MTRSLTKYACLDCQRVFKRPADATQKICPRCAGLTYRTGSDFRPPSAGDKKRWAVASFLIKNGFPYYRLGLQYPTTLKEARRFVDDNASLAVDMDECSSCKQVRHQSEAGVDATSSLDS